MGYNTAETEWPSSTIVSEESKALLDHYFNLLDTNEATAGDTIAKLFTQDGSMITSAGIIQGSEKLRASRLHAWDVIKTRAHRLTRVYVFDPNATDLLVLGSAVQGLANGKLVSGEWAARICLEQTPAGLKIKLHQVWADFGNAQKAIQEALMSNSI